VAMGTLELIVPVTAFVDMGASAERANYHLAPTLFGDEITATLVVIEMVDEGDKGVEMFKCKSHSLKVFTSYLYLKTMGIFQKVQRFLRWTSVFYEIFGVIRYIVPIIKYITDASLRSTSTVVVFLMRYCTLYPVSFISIRPPSKVTLLSYSISNKTIPSFTYVSREERTSGYDWRRQ
jgi:hypothetical protein